MPPPPQKVKHSVVLKTVHSEQFSKLQQKHQQESDLLEDIRTFANKRSTIEKEYAQALLKLTQQYMKKPVPHLTELPNEDGQDFKKPMGSEELEASGMTIHTVWKTVLDETDRVAKIRQHAADTYSQQIFEACKPIKATRTQGGKKLFDHMKVLQSELTQSVGDMLKGHKAYSEEEHIAHDARNKAADADSKVRNKSTGIFTSLAKLQQQSAKLNQRKEQCESKSTFSRNEYVLALSAANAHSSRYYSHDLPELMKSLDGDLYDSIRDFFTILSTTELECCGVTQECFTRILTDSTKISRSYNNQCFLHDHAVLTDLVQYQFEAQDSDPISIVCKDHNASHTLDEEAKKWSMCVAKEEGKIRQQQRQMQMLVDGTVTNGSVTKGSDDSVEGEKSPSSPIDPEIKMDVFREHIRKAELNKLKGEARLEALREGGVGVDQWLDQANAQMEKQDEEDALRHSVRSESNGCAESRTQSMADVDQDSVLADNSSVTSQPAAPVDSTYVNYQEEDDFVDDTFVENETTRSLSAGYSSGRVYPLKCYALYNFEASNGDELTIQENESLELIGDGDGDGWLRAQNASGQHGFVPENYVRIVDENSTIDPNEMSVDADPEDVQPQIPEVTTTSPDRPDRISAYSSTDYEVQAANEGTVDQVVSANGQWARALYDYTATCDEELTFCEGQLIQIIRKEQDGVDDGFWEGMLDGVTGVFPSLVVEELLGSEAAAAQITSPDRPGPPAFSPPELGTPPPHLQITQPTPSDEDLSVQPQGQSQENGHAEKEELKEETEEAQDKEELPEEPQKEEETQEENAEDDLPPPPPPPLPPPLDEDEGAIQGEESLEEEVPEEISQTVTAEVHEEEEPSVVQVNGNEEEHVGEDIKQPTENGDEESKETELESSLNGESTV